MKCPKCNSKDIIEEKMYRYGDGPYIKTLCLKYGYRKMEKDQ